MIDPKPGDEGKRVVYARGRPNEERGEIVTWNDDYVLVRFDRNNTKIMRALRSSLEFDDNGQK